MEIQENFRKSDSWDYKASEKRMQVLHLDDRSFVWICGSGDPNGPGFAQDVAALYAVSYAVRMSYREAQPPKAAHSYTVGVLQGHWTLKPGALDFSPERKDQLQYCIMLRQPAFLTPELFESYRSKARQKAEKTGRSGIEAFGRLEFGCIGAGSYAQILHVGPYDNEPESFARLHSQLEQQGLQREGKDHWELYLSDPRKASSENMKTILRVKLQPG